jgi:tetratricopeptide (TPR) repeat protein
MSTKISASFPAEAITEMVQQAASLREEGKADDALALLQMAVELDPDSAQYVYELGRVYLDLNNFDDAVTSLARAVDLHEDHWAARYWLGVAYIRLQEWEEAEEHLSLVAAHEPLFPGGHFYLGVAREELGKLDLAQLAYEQVTILNPSDARTHFFLGCLAAGRAQMQKARAELELLETLDTDLAAELDECLRFCDALDKLGPKAAIAFVEKVEKDGITYEVLEASDARTARAFLFAREMKRSGYVVRIITPKEGTWCLDGDGLYLEKLLPYQSQLRAAKVTGTIVGEPSPVHLAAAESGARDNCVIAIRCGHCGHIWPDALRLHKSIAVRCPECGTINKVEPSD